MTLRGKDASSAGASRHPHFSFVRPDVAPADQLHPPSLDLV